MSALVLRRRLPLVALAATGGMALAHVAKMLRYWGIFPNEGDPPVPDIRVEEDGWVAARGMSVSTELSNRSKRMLWPVLLSVVLLGGTLVRFFFKR